MQEQDGRRVSDEGVDRFDAPVVTDVVPVSEIRRGTGTGGRSSSPRSMSMPGDWKAFAFHAVRDTDVADDLVQETFLRLVEATRMGSGRTIWASGSSGSAGV